MTELNFRDDIKVTYIQHAGDDETVARAARASTGKDLMTFEKKNGLIRYLVEDNHTSPMEHTLITVRVEAPITVAREWLRHRTQSYSELSMRFAEASPEFYIPAEDRPLANAGSGAHPDIVEHAKQDELHSELVSRRKSLRAAEWAQYQWEIEQGIANEVARDNVPVSTYTTFWASANLNNWFKFLYLRNGKMGAPQHEIVEGAKQVQDIIRPLFPIVMSFWEREQGIQRVLREQFYEQAEELWLAQQEDK